MRLVHCIGWMIVALIVEAVVWTIGFTVAAMRKQKRMLALPGAMEKGWCENMAKENQWILKAAWMFTIAVALAIGLVLL